MKKEQKLFWRLLFISALIWCIVPLLRQSLPMDTQEAIIWGKYCLWGTTKHPPLSGWIAYAFYHLLGQTDFSMYLLSQICVVIGLVGIYKLAKCFLSPQNALLATAFQLGIVFYHFSATEFNVNVLSLAIWPWCTYYFWQAYKDDKIKHWILFGLLMGVNILNKYIGGVLGVAIGLFVIFTRDARRVLKNPKAYFSAFICFAVCLPHLIWLYENNFKMLEYIALRNPTGKVKSFVKHFFYPIKFLLAQVMFIAPAMVTYIFFIRKQNKQVSEQNVEKRRFLLCIGIVPTLFWVLKSFISGSPLKDMWNFPSLFICGILVFYFYVHEWTEQRGVRFIKAMFGWSMLFAFGYGVQCLTTTSSRFRSDCNEVVETLIMAYEKQTSRPLAYVGGSIWFSDMMSLYSKKQVKPMIFLDPAANPWFNKKDFEQKGAFIIAESEKDYAFYNKKLKRKLHSPNQLDLMYKNYFGKKKIQPIFWGIYEGENNEK